MKADDLKGIWTVGGVKFDLDLATKLAAFVDADTQVKLNKALNDLGIENVKAANMPDYLDEKEDFIDGLEAAVTVEDIQSFVNDVNKDVEESGTKAEQKDEALEAVQKALKADNDVLLLQALQNDLFERVNAEWLLKYKAELTATATDAGVVDFETLKFDDIQTDINTKNDAEIDSFLKKVTNGTDAFNPGSKDIESIKTKDLNDAKALIEGYATLDKDGKYVDTDLDTALDQIQLQLAVANVLSATTPNTLKNRLEALDAIDKDMGDDLDMKKYVHANARNYIDGVAGATQPGDKGLAGLEDFATVSDIQDVIDNVNTKLSTDLVTKVNDEAKATTVDAAKLLKALQNLGVDYVAESNKEQYKIDASDFETASGAGKIKADVQTQVIISNINAIDGADKTKVVAALNVLGIKNVVADNAEAYEAADFEVGSGKAIDTGTVTTDKGLIAAVQDIVDGVNHDETVEAQVKTINEAEEVAEVKTALDNLVNLKESNYANADEQKIYDYLKIRTVDRDFVAAFVLEKRAEEAGSTPKQYDDVKAVAAKVNSAQTAHKDALDGINGLTFTSTPDEVVTELNKMLDENFAELNNIQKSLKAQEFQDKLVYDENGDIKTSFVTLAAVKELLFN